MTLAHDDLRVHAEWSSWAEDLRRYADDLGYLTINRAEEPQIDRLDLPEGRPAKDDAAFDDWCDNWLDDVAAWASTAIQGKAIPGVRCSYLIRAYAPKAVGGVICSKTFGVQHPAAPAPPPRPEPTPRQEPWVEPQPQPQPWVEPQPQPVGPAAVLGDLVTAAELVDVDEDEPPKRRKKTPVKPRRSARDPRSAMTAAFASLGIDEGILDLPIPEVDFDDVDDLDADLLGIVDAQSLAVLRANFAYAGRAMRATLQLSHGASATALLQMAAVNETLSGALAKSQETIMNLCDVVADQKLTSAEQEARAMKDAGNREVVAHLGGTAIKETMGLLRAKAVLEKVESIPSEDATRLALQGTSMEGAVDAVSATAEDSADEDDSDSASEVTEIEKVVERNKPPAPEGLDDLMNLLREKPWIAEGLRDPKLVGMLGDPESLTKIRMMAAFVPKAADTDPPDTDPDPKE